MGHDSSIATVANLFPDLVHNIVETVKDGEVGKARVLQKRLNKIVDAIASQGDPSISYFTNILSFSHVKVLK